MLKYLYPKIKFRDLLSILSVAVFGAVLAGAYGIVHDQVTYSISPEYFTKMKFFQFHYADFGLGNRIFAGTIGFLATWWVGFFVAWILGRRLIPDQPRDVAIRQVFQGIGLVIAVVIAFGIGGFLFGWLRGPDADYSSWEPILKSMRVDETWSFVRVAYIHNAGYMGGALGLGLALWFIRPMQKIIE